MARMPLWKRLEASAHALKKALGRETLPETLVVLGSGFKGFEQQLSGATRVDLGAVEHMPVPTVEGHGCSLVVGRLADREVGVLTGRVHLYEGFRPDEVVYPIRVASTLGVQRVLLTNAAGSLDPWIPPGQVVCLKDHLNLTGVNCLVGPEARELGEVFLDMGGCYDADWREAIMAGGGAIEGVYAGVLGPSYETPAETRMLGLLGAQVVGMSTVQEAIAAHHLRLKVAGLSFVTNMAGGLGETLSHADVLALAKEHQDALHQLVIRAVGVNK